MRTICEWIDRLRATAGPGRRDDSLEEEPRLHLELAGEDALRRAVDRDAALRIAWIEAGGAA